jgi:hypothetical protein
MSVIVRIPSARARSPERGSADQKFNEEGTELTFPLRQSVKWHDGTPAAHWLLAVSKDEAAHAGYRSNIRPNGYP